MKFWQNLKHFLIPHEGNDYKPHVLRELSVIVFLLVAVVVFAAGELHRIVVTKSNFLAAIYSSVLVELANEDRSQHSVGNLAINPLLERAAAMKAKDMAEKGYFAHWSPDGRAPWDWIKLAGYTYASAGENLAIDFTDSTDVNNAWMNSPGHRANLLNERYTEIGIATEKGIYQGRETTFVVEMFARPAVVALSPAPPNNIVAVAPAASEIAPTFPAGVKGAETESAPQESSMAIETEETDKIPATVYDAGAREPGVSKLASWKNLLMSNPRYLLYGIYALLALLILIGLGGLATIELERHHYKHVAYGFLLLTIIFSLGYIYRTVIFSSAVIAGLGI